MADYLATVAAKRAARQQRVNADNDKAQASAEQRKGVEDVVQAVRQESAKSRIGTQNVKVLNPVESVRTPDVAQVVQAVQTMTAAVQDIQLDLSPVREDLSALQDVLTGLPAKMPKVPKAERLESIAVSNLGELGSLITALTGRVDELVSEVAGLELKPEINVAAPDLPTSEPLDLSPVLAKLDAVTKALSKPAPEQQPLDLSPLITSVNQVDSAIKNLRFPIPNYILPFRDPTTGKATQITLDEDGNLPVSGGSQSSGGSSITLGTTTALTGSGAVVTPAAGQKLRVTNIKFSLSADFTSVSFRWGAGGTDFEKYLAPKSGGLYGISLSGQYLEGGTDEELYAVLSGTGTVQFNVKYSEES